MNMEKRVKTIKVEYDLQWGNDTEISEIKKDIEELEKLGCTHIDISAYVEYGCAILEITPTVNRLETDEEYADRLKIEENIKERNRQWDLQRLAELKAKYE